MKTKRIISALCACVVTILALFPLSSCKNDTDNSIYFLNFKPEIAEYYSEIAAKYKELTGITVNIATAASGTYEQTLKSEIGKADAPTIFQINGPKGYASWKDYCADLSGSELYAHLSDKSLAITSGGGVYGIPYVVEGYGIIYNKAVFDKYFSLSNRATTLTSVDEIHDFSTFSLIVADMQSRRSEIGINGVFASTSLKPGEDWRWQTHLANIPIYYEFKNNSIDLSGNGTSTVSFQYAANYKNLFDLYIENSVTDKKLLGSKQVADSMAEFALGQCAMVQNGNWAWSQISEITGNTVKSEDIGFLPMFMGFPDEDSEGICIGTENIFAINKKASAEKQRMAADFLYWLLSSDTGKKYVTEKLGFIAPFDTFDENEMPTDPLALNVIKWMNDASKNNVPWNFTIFPSQDFKDDFGAALLQYAQGTRSFESVVSTVVTRWKEEASK